MNVHSVSLKGIRPDNEDKHVIILNGSGKKTNYNPVNFFAIFDGHGGKFVSKYLQDNIPKFFMKKEVKYPLQRKYIVSVSDYIQKKLRENRITYHSGSTAIIIIHFRDNTGNEYINVINVGDSRATLCRDNLAIALTKDHKPNWPEEKDRITKLGGNIRFDGVDYRIKDLSVSRAFGDIDATPFVTHRPDIYKYKLEKNDKFIVIACDGLWDVMTNQDVVNFVLSNCYALNERINKEINIAKKLGEYVITHKGTCDNVSIIIIFF